jgi:hypothetical protein
VLGVSNGVTHAQEKGRAGTKGLNCTSEGLAGFQAQVLHGWSKNESVPVTGNNTCRVWDMCKVQELLPGCGCCSVLAQKGSSTRTGKQAKDILFLSLLDLSFGVAQARHGKGK